MAFTNIAENAPHRATYCTRPPWNHPPPYSQLVGFSIDKVMPDLLHVLNLGIGRDLCGSILKTVLKERHIFTESTIEGRMESATQSLRSFAHLHRLPLRMRRLTKKKLNWGPEKYAELRTGSGYDNSVVARWLEDLLKPFSQIYPKFCAMLWALNTSMSILYGSGWFLSPESRAKVKTLGSVFVRVFIKMASVAIEEHQFSFRCRPKLHLLEHVFLTRRTINHAVYSTWMDEDFLRHISRTLRLSPPAAAQERILQRWLLALPESLRRSMNS